MSSCNDKSSETTRDHFFGDSARNMNEQIVTAVTGRVGRSLEERITRRMDGHLQIFLGGVVGLPDTGVVFSAPIVRGIASGGVSATLTPAGGFYPRNAACRLSFAGCRALPDALCRSAGERHVPTTADHCDATPGYRYRVWTSIHGPQTYGGREFGMGWSWDRYSALFPPDAGRCTGKGHLAMLGIRCSTDPH